MIDETSLHSLLFNHLLTLNLNLKNRANPRLRCVTDNRHDRRRRRTHSYINTPAHPPRDTTNTTRHGAGWASFLCHEASAARRRHCCRVQAGCGMHGSDRPTASWKLLVNGEHSVGSQSVSGRETKRTLQSNSTPQADSGPSTTNRMIEVRLFISLMD